MVCTCLSNSSRHETPLSPAPFLRVNNFFSKYDRFFSWSYFSILYIHPPFPALIFIFDCTSSCSLGGRQNCMSQCQKARVIHSSYFLPRIYNLGEILGCCQPPCLITVLMAHTLNRITCKVEIWVNIYHHPMAALNSVKYTLKVGSWCKCNEAYR